MVEGELPDHLHRIAVSVDHVRVCLLDILHGEVANRLRCPSGGLARSAVDVIDSADADVAVLRQQRLLRLPKVGQHRASERERDPVRFREIAIDDLEILRIELGELLLVPAWVESRILDEENLTCRQNSRYIQVRSVPNWHITLDSPRAAGGVERIPLPKGAIVDAKLVRACGRCWVFVANVVNWQLIRREQSFACDSRLYHSDVLPLRGAHTWPQLVTEDGVDGKSVTIDVPRRVRIHRLVRHEPS
mmetsp:Transcript_25285/g.55271  ORF Transcript_25285/g.55271 Transcript_25285/m.55271 type:complete len:247 (+) Transcript_25285:1496-2236(+)